MSARRLVQIAVLTLTLLSATGVASMMAGAAGVAPVPSATGWWWQAETRSGPKVPPPSVVSPGELYLQSEATGATAFPALRYELSAPMAKPTLVLRIPDKPCQPGQPMTSPCRGDSGGEYAVLLACLTGSAWSPVEAGTWEDKPLVDAEHCVNGLRSADTVTWTFDLSSLQLGTLIDVAIVPGTGQSVPAPVELVFTKPAAGDLSDADPGGAVVTPPHPAATSATTAGVRPSSPLPVAPRAFHPAPALPPDAVGETATAPIIRASTQPSALPAVAPQAPFNRADPPRWPGLVLLIALAGGAGYLWRARTDQRTTPVDDGLGRFVAPREGVPPALR